VQMPLPLYSVLLTSHEVQVDRNAFNKVSIHQSYTHANPVKPDSERKEKNWESSINSLYLAL
jgi:hypothetical protein